MEIRSTGLGLGFGMLNAIIIMLVQVTPIAIEAISWKYFLIFIFTDVIFVIVFYFVSKSRLQSRRADKLLEIPRDVEYPIGRGRRIIRGQGRLQLRSTALYYD